MIASLLERVLRRVSDSEGATAVEYAIVASLIAAVVAASVMGLGSATNGLFQALSDVWR